MKRLNFFRLIGSFAAVDRLQSLRLLTIGLPITALVVADLLRNALFPASLHSVPARLVLYGGSAAAVTVFAWLVFRVVQTLQEALTEKNRQLEALSSTTAAAAENVELDALLSTGLDRALDAVRADAGLICLIDSKRREHSAVCIRGFSDEFAERVQQAKLSDDPVAERVVDTGRPVIVERVESDPLVAQAAGREGIGAFVSAPLIAGGNVLGILVLASKSEREFTPADLEFIEALGGHLGVVIRNGMLYEEARQRAGDLNALLTVGGAVASSLDLDQVLGRALDTVTSVSGAESAEIWLVEQGGLRLARRVGPDVEEFVDQSHFAIGEGLPGIAAEARELVISHDLANDKRFLRRGMVAKGYQTYCAAPILFQGEVVAVLGIAARSADALTDPAELRLLEGIAEQIAPAIENARLYSQVQDAAVVLERERIAREMHDGVGQVLAYVNTQTLAVRKLLADDHLAEALTELDNMERAARELSSEVRESILGLRMSPGKDGGFLGAILAYIDGFHEIWQIEVQLDISDAARTQQLSPSVEIQLMRIIQEALTNVRKHAAIHTASVSIDAADGELHVAIRDAGCGFDIGNVEESGVQHFGLQTMRERAGSVGAVFDVESGPGDGTCVTVTAPTVAGVAA